MRCYAVFVLLATWSCLSAQAPSDLRGRIELLGADLRDLARRHDVPMSNERATRLRARFEQEQRELAALGFDGLDREARVDLLLLENHVARELAHLADSVARDDEVRELLPFASRIVELAEARRRLEDVAPRAAADAVEELGKHVEVVRAALQNGRFDRFAPAALARASQRLGALRRTLASWFEFRDGYDPQFGWWVKAPFAAADGALEKFGNLLRDSGPSGDRSLVGDPIGEAALLRELAFEWIPYSPAELVAIAEREFAWCDAEMAKAAQELGAADWRAALELVKQRHREPGEQPALVRELALEAITFLEQRDLITIPPLAKECWRMGMMSREAQRTNPFFLGGETIQVSFPTDAMAHIEKLQALRSNNEHFCRATVHHELIPGHWLQQYSQARHHTYRDAFDTPFWIEGWALYWEMRMYELGLAKGPHDRVGMLYWRKHRCARIVFSLNFHLGRWSGPQCVDYLIDRVGHERAAAEGEVRRSLSGAYGPLYQAAYMLGGLQLRALHGELVKTGAMGEKAFHDAVLAQNSIPIAMVRQALGKEPVVRQAKAWRFAD